MLRAATGTPIRRIDLANMPLALAEPEPLTLANLTTKSLTALIGVIRTLPRLRAPSTTATLARRSPSPAARWRM